MTTTAQVQPTEPPRVLVTVTGYTGGTLTVWRVDEETGEQSPVRGAYVVSASDPFLITDAEAPFGVPLHYTTEHTAADGTVTTESSNTVTLTTSGPWITNPLSGVGISLTIVDWPEYTYRSRQSVIDVSGRAAPIVISDVRTLAASTLTLITRTRAELIALKALLADGDTLQVRPVCGAVEAAYLSFGDVTETRKTPTSKEGDPVQAGSDWRRLWTCAVQEVDVPAPAIPAVADTLTDLHNYLGDTSTLTDLANAFPPPATLLTIAQTPLQEA